MLINKRVVEQLRQAPDCWLCHPDKPAALQVDHDHDHDDDVNDDHHHDDDDNDDDPKLQITSLSLMKLSQEKLLIVESFLNHLI